MADWGRGEQNLYPVHTITAAAASDMSESISIPTQGVWTAYTELIASTDATIVAIDMFMFGDSSFNRVIADLAVGSAGNEVPIIDRWFSSGGNEDTGHTLPNRVRVNIPTGSRISIRAKNFFGSSRALSYQIVFYAGGAMAQQPAAQLTNLIAGDSSLPAVAFGSVASADTWSAWTEIIASTPFNINGGFFCFGCNSTSLASGTAHFLLQVAIGGAGNEEIIAGPIGARNSNQENPMIAFPLGLSIPAGTRISARSQYGLADASDSELIGTVMGYAA